MAHTKGVINVKVSMDYGRNRYREYKKIMRVRTPEEAFAYGFCMGMKELSEMLMRKLR